MTGAPATQNAPALPPFYFLATFWGESFGDQLCRFALRSLRAPGNVPALRYRHDARLLLATPRADWERLQRNRDFQALSALIRTEHVLVEEAFPGEHKYVRMSRGHRALAEICFRDKAVAININPDSIYPDGSIAEAQRYARAGKRVVLCAAIRFDQDGIVAELEARGLLRDGEPLVVPMREAVDLGLRHLHPESKAAVWGASNFGRLAPQHERHHLLTCCIWPVQVETGCIIATHNWAPFLVNYATLAVHDTATLDGRAIDGDYIYENFGLDESGSSIHIVTDSDSIFLLGMTPRAEMVPPQENPFWKRWPMIGDWTCGYVLNRTVYDPAIDPLRRRNYAVGVRWHTKDIDERWGDAEAVFASAVEEYIRVDLADPAYRPTGWRWLRARWLAFIYDALYQPQRWAERTGRLERRVPAALRPALRRVFGGAPKGNAITAA